MSASHSKIRTGVTDFHQVDLVYMLSTVKRIWEQPCSCVWEIIVYWCFISRICQNWFCPASHGFNALNVKVPGASNIILTCHWHRLEIISGQNGLLYMYTKWKLCIHKYIHSYTQIHSYVYNIYKVCYIMWVQNLFCQKIS